MTLLYEDENETNLILGSTNTTAFSSSWSHLLHWLAQSSITFCFHENPNHPNQNCHLYYCFYCHQKDHNHNHRHHHLYQSPRIILPLFSSGFTTTTTIISIIIVTNLIIGIISIIYVIDIINVITLYSNMIACLMQQRCP